MSLFSKVGSFAANTSTGNQSITGLGFLPKVVIFLGNSQTADGTGADASSHFGVGISSSSRRAIASSTKDASAPFTVESGNRDDGCVFIVNAGGTGCRADFVSQDSDGFTVNWATAPPSAYIVNYLALGGPDLTNVALGTFTPPAATGSQSITGVGFKPDAIFCFQGIDNGTIPSDDTASNYQSHIGFGTSSSARGYAGWRGTGGSGAWHEQSTVKVLGAIGSAGIFIEADLTSLDSDGFTLNYSTATAGSTGIFYLALKGALFSVGSFNQPTSTGNQANTGVGFRPSALLLLSDNDTSANDNTSTVNQRVSLGVASGSAARVALWRGLTDTTSPAVAKQNLDRTKIIKLETEAATPTVNAAADLVSFDTSGFTLNWTTADATAREILYLAIGENAAFVRQDTQQPYKDLIGVVSY